MIFRFERGNRLNHGLTGLRRLKAGAQWIYYGITIALIIHSLDPTLQTIRSLHHSFDRALQTRLMLRKC